MKRTFLILGTVFVAIGSLAACGGKTISSPTPTPPPPTATLRPPTATIPPPTATSPPPPTSVPEQTNVEEHKFRFVAALGTQEEGERIESILTGLPGIEEVRVTEISITVEYNPALTTLDEIQEAIESLGYKVER